MALQLITGSSGAGKTHYMLENIVNRSYSDENSNYIIIVPEQFTMETQRAVVQMHKRHSVSNIDIVSFKRLAFRIFDELAVNSLNVLEDTGKSLVIRKVAGEKKKELVYFKENLRKPGFINEMKSLISEFMQYGVDSDSLDKMLEKTREDRPLLYSKLADVSAIYKGMREFLQDRYITAEEISDLLCSIIDNSKIIKNSVICLDGYTGFTPVQYKLLERMLTDAREVMVTVTIDSKDDLLRPFKPYELFAMSRQTIKQLYEICERNKIKIERPVILGTDGTYRHRDSAPLAFLEQNMFKRNAAPYEKEQSDIAINVSMNPNQEAQYVAQDIVRLVREEHLRYRDIAVITGDIAGYSNYLETAFDKNEVPFFMDDKNSIMNNPLTETVRAVLEVVSRDFSYDSIFRYLRSGMSNIDENDIDYFENYVRAMGIRGHKRWNEKWIRNVWRKTSDLERVNKIREHIISDIMPLYEVFKDDQNTVYDYTTALYEFLVKIDAQRQIEAYRDIFESAGNMALYKEYSQIYGLIMELFDKMVLLLRDEHVRADEYLSILDAGFEQIEVSIIPPGADCVVIGDIERTRLKEIKVLYFMGMNDGIIPKKSDKGGILTELDREEFTKNDIELAPDDRQKIYIQNFYLYLNLTKPSQKLNLSYSKTDSSGNTLRPASIVQRIKRLYNYMEIVDLEKTGLSQITTPVNSLGFFTEGLNAYREDKIDDEWLSLYDWYMNDEEYAKRVNNLIESAFSGVKEERLSKAVANAIYGTELNTSITRLEKYASCAFSHFLTYGLMLEERQEYKLASVDLGNIFHNVLERFSGRLKEKGYSFRSLSEDLRRSLVKECVGEVTADYRNTVFKSSARNEFFVNRIETISDRTIWALQQHIEKGSFEPDGYEVSFALADDMDSINFKLSDSERMKLRGRIDRLDVCEDTANNNVYVKVIDYKSGNTKFDMVAIYYGMQLQLVVYMDAAMEITKKKYNGRNVVPAGMFYYNIKDPIVDGSKGHTEEEIEHMIKQELKMSGLVNDNEAIIELLDEGLEGTSDIIPVRYNKGKKLAASSSVASTNGFNAMSSYVKNKITEIGKEILDGNIQIDPYKNAAKNACEYCKYNAVCGFDLKIPGYRYRTLKKFKDEEIWDKIRGDE